MDENDPIERNPASVASRVARFETATWSSRPQVSTDFFRLRWEVKDGPISTLIHVLDDQSDAASPQHPYQNAHGELHEIATKELYTTPRASVTVTVDTLDGEEMWNLEADEFSDEDGGEVDEDADQDVATAAGDGSFKGPTIEVRSAGASLTIGEYMAAVHPWLVSLRAKYLWEHGMLMGYEPLPQETKLWVKPTDAEDVVLLDSVNHGTDGTHEWRDIAKNASNIMHGAVSLPSATY